MLASSSDEDSDDTIFALNGPGQGEEEEALLSDNEEQKISGKMWGRVKNVFARRSAYPKSVFLILGTEFCERFNYYGMRTVLVIYLTQWLGMAHHRAVAWYHGFSMLAYFSPVLGAIIADGYLGRYKTILYLALVYAVGTVVLSLTALPPPEFSGPIVGLFLISLGTGGIKPCVSAFGGDQFTSQQVKEQMSFFSAFYFMINLGAMLSTILTPILRADVHCIEDSCYPLAFGLPGGLMVVSLLIFISGKNYYKHSPPTGNLFGRVVKCILYGMVERLKQGKKSGKDSHWLDYATDKYEENFVSDVKSLLDVLWLFLPLPMFWALFDQQGSRWTLQAVQMNGQIGDWARVKPDQLQVLNPLLILVLIPVFEKVVYPCLDSMKIPNRSLQRMCVGMGLCSLAFVVAGFLQLNMENLSSPKLSGQSGLTFLNTVNCTVHVNSTVYSGTLEPYQKSPYLLIPHGDLNVTLSCEDDLASIFPLSIRSPPDQVSQYRVLLTADMTYRLVLHEHNGSVSLTKFKDDQDKDEEGQAKISLLSYLHPSNKSTTNVQVWSQSSSDGTITKKFQLDFGLPSSFTKFEPGQYSLCVVERQTSEESCVFAEKKLTFGSGSVQTVVLQSEQLNGSQTVVKILEHQFVTLTESQVSMFWLIPQYVLITTGEILFSITGLSFAYSQAPTSMKSVLQAAWLMTTAFGDLVVVLVAEAQLMPSQSAEFFLFAGLMALDMLLFIGMAIRYKSRAPTPEVTEFHTDTTTLVQGNRINSQPMQDLSDH